MRWFVALLVATIGAACSSSNGSPDQCFVRTQGSGGGIGGGGGSGQPIRCQTDAECGPGARCDSAIDPPTCVQLYCLPTDAPCSDDSQCATGTQCYNSTCNPCNVCGDQCA